MPTETPTDWRRLFAGHANDADAYRITIAAGPRGSFISPRPDRSLARVKVGEADALKCTVHGALIPSDMADAVHDEALALARDYAESKHIHRVRYRVELLQEGESLGKSRSTWAPISPEDVPEDTGTEDSAKELRSLALLRHADRQVQALHKLNLEQAERYVQLAEQHGASVQSYNEALLGMVQTVIAEREAADRPASLDPEVAREGLEILRTFMMMQAQAKASSHVGHSADAGANPDAGDDNARVLKDVLASLDEDEVDELKEWAPGELFAIETLADEWSPVLARALLRKLTMRAAELMSALTPGLLAKLRPLGTLDVSVGT